MKKILILLLLSCLSCQKEPVILFSKAEIKTLAQDDFEVEIPPRYSFINLFILVDNGQICETNINILYHIYKKEYSTKHKDFQTFLYEFLNQKESLTKLISYLPCECFKLNSEVSKAYSSMNLKDFINHYTIKEASHYTFKDTVKDDQNSINTIAYYLFLNKYDLGFDDYAGYYHITPLAQLIK